MRKFIGSYFRNLGIVSVVVLGTILLFLAIYMFALGVGTSFLLLAGHKGLATLSTLELASTISVIPLLVLFVTIRGEFN